MRKLVLCLLALLIAVPRCFASEITPLPKETVIGYSEEDDVSILSPGTVSVVRPDKMQGEQKNLPELLKRVPGLHVVEAKGRGAYTVASVRGRGCGFCRRNSDESRQRSGR